MSTWHWHWHWRCAPFAFAACTAIACAGARTDPARSIPEPRSKSHDCVPYRVALSEWRSGGAAVAPRCACTWVPEQDGATLAFSWRPWDMPTPIPPSLASILPRAGSTRAFKTGPKTWFISVESGEFGGAAYIADERTRGLVEVPGLRCGGVAQAGRTIYCTTVSTGEGLPESIVRIDTGAARAESVRLLQLPRAGDALAVDPMRAGCFLVVIEGALVRACQDGQVSTMATGLGHASGGSSMVIAGNGDVLVASSLGVTRVARDSAVVEHLEPPKPAQCEHTIY